jgi:hypothetical protein
MTEKRALWPMARRPAGRAISENGEPGKARIETVDQARAGWGKGAPFFEGRGWRGGTRDGNRSLVF